MSQGFEQQESGARKRLTSMLIGAVEKKIRPARAKFVRAETIRFVAGRDDLDYLFGSPVTARSIRSQSASN